MTQLAFFSGAFCLMSTGKFDTRRRYLRNGTAADRFRICKDRTWDLEQNGSGTNRYPSWRFTDGDTLLTYNANVPSPPSLTFVPPVTFVNL